MRRQYSFHENPDSDQSISDEEEFDQGCLGDCVSLDGSAQKKEELPLPVRLEILRGNHEQNFVGRSTHLSLEKQAGVPLQDDVEMPDFDTQGKSSHSSRVVIGHVSDEEVITDDEGNRVLSKSSIVTRTRKLQKNLFHIIRNEQDGAIHKESEAVKAMNGSTLSSASYAAYAKANGSGHGIWGKAERKISQLQSHKVGSCPPLHAYNENNMAFKIERLPKTLEAVEPGTSVDVIGDSLEGVQEEEKQLWSVPAEVEALACGSNMRSMAELFDNLQDMANLPSGSARKYLPQHCRQRGKRVQLIPDRNISHLGDKTIDSEDSSETLAGGSSSDDTINDQHLKLVFPEKKLQTMADRFQEALGASSLTDEGSFVAAPISIGAGIFGKLQQVMQIEKERDLTFLKLQSVANTNNEPGCIDVNILARYLDAKLTVCYCSFGDYKQKSLLPGSLKSMARGGNEKTISLQSKGLQ
ncbi:Kinetochore protein [Quillaja saponaria]|uniref:Kinetochore protein n=1 Tax=Quillaja saponaria TaxID=32244 RepID=A0AAD7VJ71_QUISA|nr:Kinetochore protein [Quillaja saponaria]